MLTDGFALLKRLFELSYPRELRDPYWWPNSGSFETVIGAILTQNTKWSNVEKSLVLLRNDGSITLDSMANIDLDRLALLIRPSGFHNTKAKRLKKLANNILDEFGEFDNFCQEVTREWLLAQEGVGFESADSILNYACYKEEMVADRYSYTLLSSIGYELEEYDGIKEWLKGGIEENLSSIAELFEIEENLARTYALFHGQIVEFCKENKKESFEHTLLGGTY